MGGVVTDMVPTLASLSLGLPTGNNGGWLPYLLAPLVLPLHVRLRYRRTLVCFRSLFFLTFTRIEKRREVKRSGGLRSCLIREFWICVVRDWPSSRQRIRASFASVLCLSWRIVPQCILLCFAFRSRWTQQTSLWSLVFKSTQYTTQYQVCIRTHCAAPT